MTDTTDTAALSDQFKSIRDDVEFYEGTQHCIAVPIKQAKALLDHLEAERQRADANAQGIRKLESQWEHRSPTQWAYDQACAALHAQRERAEKAEAELAALKGKLANPVVLPERWKPCDCIDCAYAYDSEATKKAINEAGFTVKGDL